MSSPENMIYKFWGGSLKYWQNAVLFVCFVYLCCHNHGSCVKLGYQGSPKTVEKWRCAAILLAQRHYTHFQIKGVYFLFSLMILLKSIGPYDCRDHGIIRRIGRLKWNLLFNVEYCIIWHNWKRNVCLWKTAREEAKLGGTTSPFHKLNSPVKTM